MSAVKKAHEKYLEKKKAKETIIYEKLEQKLSKEELQKTVALYESQNEKAQRLISRNRTLIRWENKMPGKRYFDFICELMETSEIQNAIIKRITSKEIVNDQNILIQYVSHSIGGCFWENKHHQFYINSQFDEEGILYQLFQNPENYEYKIKNGNLVNCKIYVKSYWWFDFFFFLPFCYQYVSIVLDTTSAVF